MRQTQSGVLTLAHGSCGKPRREISCEYVWGGNLDEVEQATLSETWLGRRENGMMQYANLSLF